MEQLLPCVRVIDFTASELFAVEHPSKLYGHLLTALQLWYMPTTIQHCVLGLAKHILKALAIRLKGEKHIRCAP